MIACRGVSAGYGRSIVLRGVSLSLEPGKLNGILGPNGSGKSTLLRCLTGLLRPRQGEIRYEGREIYGDMGEREVARNVALVPQEESPAHPLSVRELIQLGRTPHLGRFGWLHRADLFAVERAIAEMDLQEEAERRITELSGGERKRAVIARALAQEARVLMLDEPTAHLDVSHALDLFALLRRLADAGRTVLVASHEIWQLARYCDRLLLLDRGRLKLAGSPRKVLGSQACARVFGVSISLKRQKGRIVPVIMERLSGHRTRRGGGYL